MTSPYRLETCAEGIARLWRGDTVVALIGAHGNGWHAKPCNVPGARGWGWSCPTRRQAVEAVTKWLLDR